MVALKTWGRCAKNQVVGKKFFFNFKTWNDINFLNIYKYNSRSFYLFSKFGNSKVLENREYFSRINKPLFNKSGKNGKKLLEGKIVFKKTILKVLFFVSLIAYFCQRPDFRDALK